MAEQQDISIDAVLTTKGLTKRYRDFWGRERVTALDNLDISVQSGEVFGLLGPNGSGKTTTIKLLLGLIQPSSGDAFVFGRDPGDTMAKRRLGYLPEETYLYKFLNSEETLRFYGQLFGLSGAVLNERIDYLIDLVGLGHARKRRLGEYSKGMARRLGLAQALINDPDLVILDEPTSGLDPLGSEEVKHLILHLKEQGKTVLLCSHLLADVEDVCDRLAILYRGVLREYGSVDDILTASDRTVIELRNPAAEVLENVRAEAGDALLGIDHPRLRLDQHFRDIVAKAQESDQAAQEPVADTEANA